jgi:hypothetical protein
MKGQVGAGDVGAREHRIVEAMERGRYAAQLAWWLEHFARERFLLLQYERCVQSLGPVAATTVPGPPTKSPASTRPSLTLAHGVRFPAAPDDYRMLAASAP